MSKTFHTIAENLVYIKNYGKRFNNTRKVLEQGYSVHWQAVNKSVYRSATI
jgi:hypothetical protein